MQVYALTSSQLLHETLDMFVTQGAAEAELRENQIAGSLQLTRGNMDRLEKPAGEQTRQLARVAAVGLDPVAWPLQHQLRRHHLTIDTPARRETLPDQSGRTAS